MAKLSNDAIQINDLSKQYSGFDQFALENLRLTVKQGEVYGFLGPNGAGKSTTIKLLMNFIQPSAGSAKILGKDIVADSVRIKESVGYLSGDITLYPKMSGKQFLEYMSALQPRSDKTYAAKLIKRLHADTDKKLGDLSRGNRQKIAIIQAFMHRPDILILDEPTTGLDPLMQEVFFEIVSEAKKRGAAIFVSSHVMSEVQKMCDRVGIIRNGKLVGEYVISELAVDVAQTFDIVFKNKPPIAELSKIPGLKILSKNSTAVTLHMNGNLSPLFKLLASHEVVRLDTRTLDLEETFLHFYKDQGEKS